jgi:hypothetical protein
MATKGVGRPLTILLQADTTGLAQGLADAQTGIKKMSKSINKAAQVASVALGGLTTVAINFAKAAAEDEASARILAQTLKNVTGATAEQTAAVEDYISATSLSLGIQDDKLRPALGRLIRSTEDVTEAQKLMNLALDISAATGKDVDAVANALGKAYDGNAAALGKLGLGVDSSILKSKDFGVVFDDLTKKFTGFAETEAATTQGGFNRMTVAIDEAKEAIGYGLLPFVDDLADALTKIAPKITENKDTIVALGVAVGVTSAAILALKFILAATNTVMVIATFISATLKIAYLTLAAAVGSATAAQTLAELTYKRSIVALVAYRIAMVGLAITTGIATAAQYALNLAMSLNPVSLLIIGIAALAAGFVIAYKKIEPFRDLMNSIYDKIVQVVNTVKNSFLGNLVGGLFDGFRASGGPVRQGNSYVVGEAGPELFTATTSGNISPSGSFGNGGGVNITINGAIDAESVRRQLENLFQNSARRTGAINLIGATL